MRSRRPFALTFSLRSRHEVLAAGGRSSTGSKKRAVEAQGERQRRDAGRADGDEPRAVARALVFAAARRGRRPGAGGRSPRPTSIVSKSTLARPARRRAAPAASGRRRRPAPPCRGARPWRSWPCRRPAPSRRSASGSAPGRAGPACAAICSSSFVGLVALGREDQEPEGRRAPRRSRRARRILWLRVSVIWRPGVVVAGVEAGVGGGRRRGGGRAGRGRVAVAAGGGGRARRRRAGAARSRPARSRASSARSKKTTISKVGRVALAAAGRRRRWRRSVAAAAVAGDRRLSDLERRTRVTPSTSRRRAISLATCVWPGCSPASVIAGAVIAPRSGLGPRRRSSPCEIVAGEVRQRHVGRDGAREVAQRPLPVEARAGEVRDGLDARLGRALEVGVGLELGGLRLHGGRLSGHAGRARPGGP